ncbi:MAG: TRAP transporter substrate-binding protein [Thermoleophilaceae bacterium]
MRVLAHPARVAGLGLLAAACVLGGCGGHARAPMVLRVEGADPAGPEHNAGVVRFSERLAQLSHGKLRTNVVIVRSPADPTGAGIHDPVDDQTLIRRVEDGRTDLAWVGTQVFNTIGVRAFDALDAPMLIDSNAGQAAVLRSRLPATMLADVNRLGLSGLAVLGRGLSSPVSTQRPLVAAGDYRGLTWRVLRSGVRDAAVRALDGRPTHRLYPYAMLQMHLRSREIDAFEADLDSLFFQLVPQTPTAYVTDNVRLWPDASALVANSRRLAELSAAQRGWVRRAARDAQAYSARAADRDGEAARDLCATGVRFAEAPPATVAALRRSFAPVYRRLGSDPVTKAYIERIRRLQAGVPRTATVRVPPACRAAHPRPAGSGPPVASTIPDGVYRVRLTAHDLRSAYLSGLDVQRYAGIATLTMRQGKWSLEEEGQFGRSRQAGLYSGAPARTVWTTVAQDGNQLDPPQVDRFSISYTAGTLRINPVSEDLKRAVYGSHPWERIG